MKIGLEVVEEEGAFVLKIKKDGRILGRHATKKDALKHKNVVETNLAKRR